MIRTEYPRLDEVVYRETLSNGLTVQVLPRRGFSRKAAYLTVDYGSVHTRFTLEGKEYETPPGVAHYLEHQIFEMPDERDVSAEFASLGAFVNAYTSSDLTSYYFSCTENFRQCLELLLEFVSNLHVSEESVEKERGIIDQEIGMTEDSPDSRIYENLLTGVYVNHPVRIPILGTRESIRDITPQVLNLCHRAFYTPGNMVLSVVGDVEPEEVSAIALAVLGPEPRPWGIKETHWPEPSTTAEREITARMEISMPMFCLAFKSPPCGSGEAMMRKEMTADLASRLLCGDTSQMYQKLYEEGVIDSSFGGGFQILGDGAMMIFSGDSDDPRRVREEILAEAQRICREGISREDFLRMKRSVLGEMIRGLDSFEGLCSRLYIYHLCDYDFFRFPALFDTIEPREVLDFLAEIIREENSCLSVIYPNE